MITIQLPEQWSEKLVRMPESGMGYQRINISLKDGRTLRDVIVLNAEQAQVSEPFDPADIIELQLAR
jgi:hypothetical protein